MGRVAKLGVPGQAEGLENLPQRQEFAIPKDDHLIRLLAQLALDEAQQVLLVHAGAVVNMRVHLVSAETRSEPEMIKWRAWQTAKQALSKEGSLSCANATRNEMKTPSQCIG